MARELTKHNKQQFVAFQVEIPHWSLAIVRHVHTVHKRIISQKNPHRIYAIQMLDKIIWETHLKTHTDAAHWAILDDKLSINEDLLVQQQQAKKTCARWHTVHTIMILILDRHTPIKHMNIWRMPPLPPPNVQINFICRNFLTFKSSCIKCILRRAECLSFEQRLRHDANTKNGRKNNFMQLFFLSLQILSSMLPQIYQKPYREPVQQKPRNRKFQMVFLPLIIQRHVQTISSRSFLQSSPQNHLPYDYFYCCAALIFTHKWLCNGVEKWLPHFTVGFPQINNTNAHTQKNQKRGRESMRVHCATEQQKWFVEIRVKCSLHLILELSAWTSWFKNPFTTQHNENGVSRW